MSQEVYFQDNLLLLNHARLGTNNNGGEGSHGRDLLVSLMFSHFDENNSGLLEAEELKRVSNLCDITNKFLTFSY